MEEIGSIIGIIATVMVAVGVIGVLYFVYMSMTQDESVADVEGDDAATS